MYSQCKTPVGSTPRKYNHLNERFRAKGIRFSTKLKPSVTLSCFQLVSQDIIRNSERLRKNHGTINQVSVGNSRNQTNPGNERCYQMMSSRENDTFTKEWMREREHPEK